jgi:hypothetical protein
MAEELAEAYNAEKSSGQRILRRSKERTYETSSDEATWRQIAPSETSDKTSSSPQSSPQSKFTNASDFEEFTAASEKADKTRSPHTISKSFKSRGRGGLRSAAAAF